MSTVVDGASSASLEQLVYRSVSTAGVASGLEMSDILAVARPANLEADVTGALTVVHGCFVQVIEGPSRALDDLLMRLKRDRRHTALEVLDRRGVPHRAFADWDMVSPRLAGSEVLTLAELLSRNAKSLDAYVSVLRIAVQRQDRMIEIGVSPGGGLSSGVAVDSDDERPVSAPSEGQRPPAARAP